MAKYGNVTKQTVGTIQRALLVLENQGGEKFFGEPALDGGKLRPVGEVRPQRLGASPGRGADPVGERAQARLVARHQDHVIASG